MPYINTIQWKIEATPERVKRREFIKKIITRGLYIFGVFIMSVFYFENIDFGKQLSGFKFFILIYIINIIIWHRFIKDKIDFREKLYTFSDDFIEIQDIKSGKVRHFNWTDFKSFGRKIPERPQVDISLHLKPGKVKDFVEGNAKYFSSEFSKYIFLRLKDENKKPNYVILMADKYFNKIIEALKVKLPEK